MVGAGCTSDWSATAAMLQGLGTVLGALAVLIAAIIGGTTVKKWRRQKLSERRIEQAERILTATYKVRRRLSLVRAAMWGNELAVAQEVLKGTGEWEKAADEVAQRRFTTAQAYYTRINAGNDDRQALDECLPMARALFGEELEQAMDKLNRVFWAVKDNVDAWRRQPEYPGWALQKKIERAIWEGYTSDGENEIDKIIKDQVVVIEHICVPVLRLEGAEK